MRTLPISVILLTLNEEENLPGALENLREWAQEVFIVDSLSTDRTVDIALEHGARIVQRRFTDFGDQWNFALSRLPLNAEWTLKLDPDERLSPELVGEMGELLAGRPEHVGYWIRRRLWFMGKPLNNIQWVLRLWRTGLCRFSDAIVNEQPIVDGSTGRLAGLMEHLDSPSLHHWYEKQNRYTTMEAIMKARKDPLAARPRLFGSSLERRMLVKSVFHRIPLRYPLLWLHHVMVQRALLAGKTGLAWAHLRVEVHRAIEYKAREMQTTGRIPEVPRAPHGDFDPRIVSSPLQIEVCRSACE